MWVLLALISAAHGFCLPEILCESNVCNTNTSVACTGPEDCPCQCTEQCPDPADDGDFCSVRDCWASVCMNASIGEFVCLDYDSDPCTSTTCFSNISGDPMVYNSTYDCTPPTLSFNGCCKMAETDCVTGVWNASMPPCTKPMCANYSAMLGYGMCELVPEEGRCCTNDTTCADPSNLCALSVCENMTDGSMGNESTGECSEVVLLNCSSSDPDPLDLCYNSQCNSATGMCENVTLDEHTCPGACCVSNETDSSCYLSGDEAWCLFTDGRFFAGQACAPGICDTPEPTPEPTREPTAEPTREPTAEPTLEPTREPTAEPTIEPTREPTREPTAEPTREPTREPSPAPTLEPTPAPTAQCFSPTQCPTDPTTKCNSATCTGGVCGFVNLTIALCPSMRHPSIADNLCFIDKCNYFTGKCYVERDYTCCSNATDGADHCYNPGGACTDAYCDVTEDTGYGTCALEVAPLPCCETNADCTGGDNCSLAYCNHVTDTCANVGVMRTCPETALCTDQVCNSMTGACDTVPAPNQTKCPGACCLPSIGMCSDVTFFGCANVSGSWLGSTTTCAANVGSCECSCVGRMALEATNIAAECTSPANTIAYTADVAYTNSRLSVCGNESMQFEMRLFDDANALIFAINISTTTLAPGVTCERQIEALVCILTAVSGSASIGTVFFEIDNTYRGRNASIVFSAVTSTETCTAPLARAGWSTLTAACTSEPTPAPTPAPPTPAPTNAPTPAPTNAPTPAPTGAPTSAPTPFPTAATASNTCPYCEVSNAQTECGAVECSGRCDGTSITQCTSNGECLCGATAAKTCSEFPFSSCSTIGAACGFSGTCSSLCGDDLFLPCTSHAQCTCVAKKCGGIFATNTGATTCSVHADCLCRCHLSNGQVHNCSFTPSGCSNEGCTDSGACASTNNIDICEQGRIGCFWNQTFCQACPGCDPNAPTPNPTPKPTTAAPTPMPTFAVEQPCNASTYVEQYSGQIVCYDNNACTAPNLPLINAALDCFCGRDVMPCNQCSGGSVTLAGNGSMCACAIQASPSACGQTCTCPLRSLCYRKTEYFEGTDTYRYCSTMSIIAGNLCFCNNRPCIRCDIAPILCTNCLNTFDNAILPTLPNGQCSAVRNVTNPLIQCVSGVCQIPGQASTFVECSDDLDCQCFCATSGIFAPRLFYCQAQSQGIVTELSATECSKGCPLGIAYTTCLTPQTTTAFQCLNNLCVFRDPYDRPFVSNIGCSSVLQCRCICSGYSQAGTINAVTPYKVSGCLPRHFPNLTACVYSCRSPEYPDPPLLDDCGTLVCSSRGFCARPGFDGYRIATRNGCSANVDCGCVCNFAAPFREEGTCYQSGYPLIYSAGNSAPVEIDAGPAPLTLTYVPDAYLTYASLLCRVRHQCGGGTEAACTTAASTCRTLGCCDYSNIL
jgi:hypothetical protein